MASNWASAIINMFRRNQPPLAEELNQETPPPPPEPKPQPIDQQQQHLLTEALDNEIARIDGKQCSIGTLRYTDIPVTFCAVSTTKAADIIVAYHQSQELLVIFDGQTAILLPKNQELKLHHAVWTPDRGDGYADLYLHHDSSQALLWHEDFTALDDTVIAIKKVGLQVIRTEQRDGH